MTKRMSPEIEEAMVKVYESGLSQRKASAQFGYTSRTCARALKRRDIIPRTMLETKGQVYTVDHNFFDKINTEEKAYWLGFIAADGCIYNDTLFLFLAERDKNHIEKFKKSIGTNHLTRIKIDKTAGKKYKSVGIEINSPHIIESLKELGITENKSLTIEPPTDIPQRYATDFWRGAFDGDGSISFYHRRKDYVSAHLSFCGNRAMVWGFSNFISSIVKTDAIPHKRKDKNLYYVYYGGVRCPKDVVAILYAGSNFYLDRKRELAKHILQMKDGQRRLNFSKRELEEAHDKYGNWHEAARHLGISIGSINALVKRVGASRTKWRRK